MKVWITSTSGRAEKRVVDFSTLDDLLAFVSEYGQCVISEAVSDKWRTLPAECRLELEIYDGYRE